MHPRRHLSTKTAILCVSISSICATLSGAEPSAGSSIAAARHGKELQLEIVAPSQIKEVELRIYSSRNESVSKYTDVSPYETDPGFVAKKFSNLDHDLWYPVVDVGLSPGMAGVAVFEEGPEISCIVNAPYWQEPIGFESVLNIPLEQLEHWENSLRVTSPSRKLQSFYLSKRIPMVMPQRTLSIPLLTEQWNGRISMYSTGDDAALLAEAIVASAPVPSPEGPSEDSLSKENLLQALDDCVGFTERSQNRNPESPGFGGLNLFYDLDAATYRTSYWMWGWGPSVRLLLDAAKLDSFADKQAELETLAKEIGQSTRNFLWHAPNTPYDDIMVSRWDREQGFPKGIRGGITYADALFLAGWAWIPLYEEFGDETYLQLTYRLSEATDDLMDEYKIIPHSYFFDQERWGAITLEENGFGVEGFAEAYRVTQDPTFREVGEQFLQQHIDILEQPDGGWGRSYNRMTGKVSAATTHARGQGWAMEGLLAAYRLSPSKAALDRCRRMADNFVGTQLESGAWAWKTDHAIAKVGLSEKGTALWSYLLYKTWEITDDPRYLESARKALAWCLRNRYTGRDLEARGSIVGRGPQSAVGYRRWYDISCVYTSSFFGLAILEELKLNEK